MRDIQMDPLIASCASLAPPRYAAMYSASPTANRPTAIATTSMPSSSSGTPNAKRACPVWLSIPTSPKKSPRNRLARPLRVELPSTAATVTNAKIISAKYSAGPKAIAISTTIGASSVSRMVAMVPATNDPIAEVASAGPARPRLAIWFPSSAVAREADSPGVLSRMVEVEPPYIAP